MLKKRIERLYQVLKNEQGIVIYNKLVARLKFEIMEIYSAEGNILFLMKMDKKNTSYIEIDDLNQKELSEIVQDLENILAE